MTESSFNRDSLTRIEKYFVEEIARQIEDLHSFYLYFEILYLFGSDWFWELSTTVFYQKIHLLGYEQQITVLHAYYLRGKGSTFLWNYFFDALSVLQIQGNFTLLFRLFVIFQSQKRDNFHPKYFVVEQDLFSTEGLEKATDE